MASYLVDHQKGAGGMHSQTRAGQEQTKTHNEQGSKHEPRNTRAASERARAHPSATHHYAREAPVGAPQIVSGSVDLPRLLSLKSGAM